MPRNSNGLTTGTGSTADFSGDSSIPNLASNCTARRLRALAAALVGAMMMKSSMYRMQWQSPSFIAMSKSCRMMLPMSGESEFPCATPISSIGKWAAFSRSSAMFSSSTCIASWKRLMNLGSSTTPAIRSVTTSLPMRVKNERISADAMNCPPSSTAFRTARIAAGTAAMSLSPFLIPPKLNGVSTYAESPGTEFSATKMDR